MPAPATPLTLRAPRSPRQFLDVQRRFYRGDPHYVPPLTVADAWQVDRRKNPFFARAEAELWIAERGGVPVGRISAVRNHVHDEFWGDRIGFFGHFEAADRDTAHALLDCAMEYVAARGATALRGPIDLSTNYRCGLLIDGELGPPVIMMPYNPRGYRDYLESWGLTKAKDLLALLAEDRSKTTARFDRLERRIRARTGAVIRSVDLRCFDRELDLLWQLYHRIWERNWGFVPMTEAEFRRSSKELKMIAVRELMAVVEIDGQPVAFAINVPDVNVAVKACGGRLLPFGWWRFWRALRHTDRARVVLLGVLPEHRKKGLDALLLHYYQRTCAQVGYPVCEASWILEDNHEMLRVLESLGARPYRRYRIYEKALAPTA